MIGSRLHLASGAVALLAVGAMLAVAAFAWSWHTRAAKTPRPPILHEDPSAVRDQVDVAAVFRFLGDGYLDSLTQHYGDARARHAMLAQVSLPGDVLGRVQSIGGLFRDLADGGDRAEGWMARARALLAARRSPEARALLGLAGQQLLRNVALTGQSRDELRRLAEALGVLDRPVSSPERQALARTNAVVAALEAHERQRSDLVRKGQIPLVAVTSVRWSAPDRALPGLAFTASGIVVTDGAPSGQPRRLVFALEDQVLAAVRGRGRFRVTLTVPRDFSPGRYTLSLRVEAEGRYPAAYEARTLDVVLLPVTVRVKMAPVAWVPGAAMLTGYVGTHSGPLGNARVEASLGGVTGVTTSQPSGKFTLALALPFNLTLVGTQRVTVRVSPPQPWLARTEADAPVFAANLLNLALASMAFVPSMVIFVQRRRRRGDGTPSFSAEGPIPDADTETTRSAGPIAADDMPLVELYRDAVHRVEEGTGASFLPHLTLREYERTVAPFLGGPLFARMSALIEPVLYARRPVTDEMLTTMRGLRQALETELTGHA